MGELVMWRVCCDSVCITLPTSSHSLHHTDQASVSKPSTDATYTSCEPAGEIVRCKVQQQHAVRVSRKASLSGPAWRWPQCCDSWPFHHSASLPGALLGLAAANAGFRYVKVDRSGRQAWRLVQARPPLVALPVQDHARGCLVRPAVTCESVSVLRTASSVQTT